MLFGLMKMDKMISNGTMQDKILLNLNFQITTAMELIIFIRMNIKMVR